jgi:hypothetical protein
MWFKNNYSKNTFQRSENVVAVVRGAQEKGKIGDKTSFCTKISAKPSFASFLILFVKHSTPFLWPIRAKLVKLAP